MALETTGANLRQLAQEALRDAQILLQQGSWSFAYYLAGYAVEFAIKVCIARSFNADAIPDKTLVNKAYEHDLVRLVGVAQLDLNTKIAASPNFARNWLVVKDWSADHRYKVNSENEAKGLVAAIGHNTDGVLAWIMTHW